VHFLLEKDLVDTCYCLDSLFHVVVENDEISTKIIKHLNSLKGGRVTFIPLNRVRAPHVSYPQNSDVVPLLKKLKFSPNFTPAFAQVSICMGSLTC
jgi:structural maintenance of chromosome 3 (chondroitin sulfate proteoglycan 6)